MLLAYHGIIPPTEWLHKPNLINKKCLTVAKLIAIYCSQIPPDEWYYDNNFEFIYYPDYDDMEDRLNTGAFNICWFQQTINDDVNNINNDIINK